MENLKKAIEIINKIDDSELSDMIHKFDTVSAPDLNLDVNDHVIYDIVLILLTSYISSYGH